MLRSTAEVLLIPHRLSAQSVRHRGYAPANLWQEAARQLNQASARPGAVRAVDRHWLRACNRRGWRLHSMRGSSHSVFF